MKRTHIYVAGWWVNPSGTNTLQVENPATEEIIGEVPLGDETDVDRAVDAARAALPSWSGLSPARQGQLAEVAAPQEGRHRAAGVAEHPGRLADGDLFLSDLLPDIPQHASQGVGSEAPDHCGRPAGPNRTSAADGGEQLG